MNEDLNDLALFVLVVRHNGFSSAARASGIEKTRLSRRVAALEDRLGVRLLNRTTRQIALTEAGNRFFTQSLAVVEGAQSAFDSVADLRKEPAGSVRLSCPQVMGQTYLAPILPGYLAAFPKVRLEINAIDREVNIFEEGFDVVLRARVNIEETAGLVAKKLGVARRVLVASPAYLKQIGRPHEIDDLQSVDTLCRPGDVHDGKGRWLLRQGGLESYITHLPRLQSDDLRVQLEAAVHGMGVALLPEPIVAAAVHANQLELVLPSWTGPEHIIHLLYPKPKGMSPSVRSLIDYLAIHLPASILERSVDLGPSEPSSGPTPDQLLQ